MIHYNIFFYQIENEYTKLKQIYILLGSFRTLDFIKNIGVGVCKCIILKTFAPITKKLAFF